MENKVLVCGGAGYIGSHVAKALKLAGFDVTVFDNFSTGNRGAVKFGQLIEGDLSDKELISKVLKEGNYTGVLHFAGSIKVPESVENPIKYYNNNTECSLNLIKACVENNVANFVFSSTAAVYGELQNGFAVEDQLKIPINPYGRSKLTTEWMLEDISNAHKSFNYTAIRYFNVCGADPDGEIGQAFPEPFHLVNIACEAAAGKRDKIAIFGEDYPTKDGTCERDYIHVSDLAHAHVLALKYMQSNQSSQVFNCGYGHGYSVKEIVDSVKKITGQDFTVEKAARRAGDPAVLVAKSDLIKEKLGWIPEFDDLDKIIQTVYNWEQGETIKAWREVQK